MTDDWRSNPAIVAIVEFALRSVIRAHVNSEDESKRLRDAMKALFGISPPAGRPEQPDLEELLYMARGYAADRGPIYKIRADYTPEWPSQADTGARSMTELSQSAIKERMSSDISYKPHNFDEKVRSLVGKFQKSRDGLLRLVVGWDQEGGADMFVQNTRELHATLKLLGINVVDPSTPNRKLKALN